MYLSRLQLNPAHPSARRDLASAYEMHRTLARAYAPDEASRPARFLWRLERDHGSQLGATVVLVQAAQPGHWSPIEADEGYLERLDGDKPVPLNQLLHPTQDYRFRLLANPTVTHEGKRFGLHDDGALLDWLARQGQRCGFAVRQALCLARERVRVRQGRSDHHIIVDSALFDGVLRATDVEALTRSLLEGVGPAKAFGMGMLSIAPLSPRPRRAE